jgi:hypothetical protein
MLMSARLQRIAFGTSEGLLAIWKVAGFNLAR